MVIYVTLFAIVAVFHSNRKMEYICTEEEKNINELKTMQTFKLQGNKAVISTKLHGQEGSLSLTHALKKWPHLWSALLY